MVCMHDADGANLFVLDARMLLGGIFFQIRTSTVSAGFDLVHTHPLIFCRRRVTKFDETSCLKTKKG